jgi:hypothetical protein
MEPVLLMALKIMLHAKFCLSVIMFLICVCWHAERICTAVFSLLEGRGGKLGVLSA